MPLDQDIEGRHGEREPCLKMVAYLPLLVILLASKPSTLSLYHTTRKGHCEDSAPRLLPAGHWGMPVVMHHTSLYLAQQRRRLPSVAKRIRAPQVQTQTHERPQTV